MRIARWYCPEAHRTFSLLPDFLAARLPSLLSSIEESVIVASAAESIEAAADALRGLEVTLPAAVRWLRRRVRAVGSAIAHVVSELAINAVAFGPAPKIVVDEVGVLLSIRQRLPPQTLNRIPTPLGFLPA